MDERAGIVGDGKVAVVAADESWPARFEEERARLVDALGDAAVRIEHVGSTAVPGLAAKPVIDIQVSVASFAPEEAYRAPLERLGYVFRPEDEREHRLFTPSDGRPRTCHIHVCEAGGEWEHRHLAFRDHLRARPDAAARYEALKRGLAARFRDDRAAYTEGKSQFIENTLARASGS